MVGGGQGATIRSFGLTMWGGGAAGAELFNSERGGGSPPAADPSTPRAYGRHNLALTPIPPPPYQNAALWGGGACSARRVA